MALSILLPILRLPRSLLLAAALAVAIVAVTALPASAGTTPFTTGGCSGAGTSGAVGSDLYTETTSSPICPWIRIEGQFVTSGGTNFWLGPGWTNPPSGFHREQHSGFVQVYGTHSLCFAGGPCGGSIVYGSQHP